MSKKFLEFDQMSSAVVESAAREVRELVLLEMRGPGDMKNAMHRVGGSYGIGYWTIWGLLYKPGKSIDAALRERIARGLADRRASADRRRAAAAETHAARTALGAIVLRGAAAMDRRADEMAGEDDWPVIPG